MVYRSLSSISRQTASVTLSVLLVPPTSDVMIALPHTDSTDCINTSEALFSPSQLSISDAVQNVPTGLAGNLVIIERFITDKEKKKKNHIPIPFPVMSNADPWMGSNIDGFSLVGSRLLVGAIPIDPARAAARSDRISACYTTRQLCMIYQVT